MNKATVAAVAMAAVLSFCFTTGASAAGWGPRTSSYRGTVRVEGGGSLTRKAGGSASRLRVRDRSRDGNAVYGYTSWSRISERCSSFGVNVWIVGSSGSSCRIAEGGKVHWSTPEISNVERTFNKTQSWCNQNGGNCAAYGYKVVTAACAQMGWPVPNSCTYAYVEYHRP